MNRQFLRSAIVILGSLTVLLVSAFPAFHAVAQENGEASGEASGESSQQQPEESSQTSPVDELSEDSMLESPNAEEVPDISVGGIDPGIAEAGEYLEENFQPMLDREPLGFDLGLVDLMVEDFTALYDGVENLLSNPSSIEMASVLNVVLVIVILAILVVFFLVFDWQFSRLTTRVQARLHLDISLWMTIWARRLVFVVGRSAPILALILLSFFPVRAIFGPVPWTLLLTDILWWMLLIRAVSTLVVTSLRIHPRNEEVQQHYRRLERFAVASLRITLVFMIILAAIERFEYHDELRAFVSFGFRITLVLLAGYLLTSRKAVLALLPPRPNSRLARALFGGLSRNYYTVLALTVLLLFFNAAGYIAAATFFLTRGYTLLIVGVLWFVLLERIHHLVEKSFEDAEQRDGHASPLPKDLQNWLIAAGTMVMIVVALRFLKVYEAIIAMLTPPLITIGGLNISLLSLVTVGLIIVATILSIRLFKSLLNAKIYPAFQVDIGVAYATNTLINYLLFVVAFILCLVALGVPLSAVMVVMASLGVGIGFGLQNIAENLISGFILLFGRAVKKGDYVTVNDLYGRVEAVGARSVVVRTPDNFSMLVPSKEIVSGRIINWTFQDNFVRVHIPIGVSYDADPSQVRDLLIETAKKHPDILAEPPPDVWLTEFGDSAVTFELLVFFDCHTTNERTLRGKFNFLLWEALREAEIEIPFPQRDLHLRSVGDNEKMPSAWYPDDNSSKK